MWHCVYYRARSASLALLKMSKICPKHVELILEINKLLFLHLVGFLYYFTYINDARSITNKVYTYCASIVNSVITSGMQL
jgi:hypothetical protein